MGVLLRGSGDVNDACYNFLSLYVIEMTNPAGYDLECA